MNSIKLDKWLIENKTMQIKKLAFSPSWIILDKQKQSSYCYSNT